MVAESINAITNMFKTVFDAIVAKPLHAAIVILLMAILYMTMANGGALSHLAPSVGVEQDRFQKVINSEGLIPNVLEEARDKIGADRLVVRQYHNGKQGISGIPFNFVQTVYAAARPGFGLTDPEAYSSYPISTMSKTLLSMYREGDVTKPQCIIIYNGQAADPFFKVYLDRYGVQTLIQCPLADRDDNIVGYIAAGYVTPHNATPDEQEAVVQAGKKVVHSLEKITEEETPWYARFIP